jgi:cell division protease FtsH
VTTADPVHKISIIPRGLAALGYTQQLPTEDRYLLTKQELMDRVAVLLGGRVAEEIVFDEVSTGAGNDLERVTDLARRMVMEYGMSRELGPVNYRNAAAPRFLPDGEGPMFAGSEGRKYSEDTARMIDREVRGIIDGTYQRVREILEQDRPTLDTLSERLLETEVVDEEELRRIMGLPRRTRPIDEGRVVHTPPVGTDQADAADASVVDEEDEAG